MAVLNSGKRIYSILIVEDEIDMRTIIKRGLQFSEYRFLEAATLDEAHLTLKNQQVDLVLLDLQLGTASGLDLLKIVHQVYPQIPVLIVSAHASKDNLMAAIHYRAHDFIEKPFTQDRLLYAVKRALESVEKKFSRHSQSLAPYQLTASELLVCELIKENMSAKEVSGKLMISCETTRTHLKNIRRKLQLTHAKVKLKSFLHSLDQ